MARRSKTEKAAIAESAYDNLGDDRDGDGWNRRSVSTIRDPDDDVDEGEGWTKRKVENRLAEAIKVVQWTTGRVGPASVKGFWPEVVRNFGELVGAAGENTLLVDGNRIRFQATSAQVTRAEEAMMWPARYVTDRRILEVLNTWLACKAYRRPWRRIVEQRGWALATADRARARAVYQIITGLEAAKVNIQ
ncbi:DUF6362 family protein [Microvirga brassicacearum]|uniref:DUF6362 domain-containing protein n=1 Tax=Microvirga brassicacearum TaxID=2580413 RepID=A0A5N3PH81_9HYPH|nr:DUF6362 family protein [Microvirga brassicacearum]KAB0269005.1 hypothetical protein FEZ63_02545 [Microvirga brassicacearum]